MRLSATLALVASAACGGVAEPAVSLDVGLSVYSIYRVEPRIMVPIARFLSWLADLRPILPRRAILGGALGQACVEDLRRT